MLSHYYEKHHKQTFLRITGRDISCVKQNLSTWNKSCLNFSSNNIPGLNPGPVSQGSHVGIVSNQNKDPCFISASVHVLPSPLAVFTNTAESTRIRTYLKEHFSVKSLDYHHVIWMSAMNVIDGSGARWMVHETHWLVTFVVINCWKNTLFVVL